MMIDGNWLNGRWLRSLGSGWAWALWVLCAAVPAGAQGPSIGMPRAPAAEDAADTATTEAVTLGQLETERVRLAGELQAAENAATTETARRLSVPLTDLRRRVDRLRAVENHVQRQFTLLKQLEEARQKLADLEAAMETFRADGPDVEPPYPLARVDERRDELDTELSQSESLRLALENARAELEAAEERLEAAGQRRRRLQDELEREATPSGQARLENEIETARLEERLAEAEVRTLRLQKQVAEEELALSDARVAALHERIETLQRQVAFTREEFNQILNDLTLRRDELEQELAEARERSALSEERRLQAREALAAAVGPTEQAQRAAVLETRSARVQTDLQTVELLEKRLALLETARELWEKRFALLADGEKEQRDAWEEEVTALLEGWRRERLVQESRLADLRTAILNLEQQRAQGTGTGTDADQLAARIEALRAREQDIQNYLADLIAIERLAGRLVGEIELERETMTLAERWEQTRNIFSRVWNAEVMHVGDDALTVRKIAIALMVFIIGWWAAAAATVALRRRVLPRMGVNESGAAAVAKILYYVAIGFIILFALQVVNIPLTLFAFLGGGLAIAIGFGAQHIANNFISGLILMIERPIRLGDMVEVNDNYGLIEEIGARSTRLRTFTNIHLLIPNSHLLENTVINWTLSDHKVRVEVKVGVAYGSPTRKVAALIAQAASEVEKILDDPAPIIVFADFGDSALVFEVHFWIYMRRLMERRIVESELRHRIDDLFREAGVVIAFPQRDVHLDAARPLEVHVLDARSDAARDGHGEKVL